jgi:hypothetical protein
VVQLQGCLGRVPRLERRVLVLRAGVGIGHTRSRARVARITGLRRASVARLERRGLRKLRALGRSGACPVVPTGAAQTTIAAPAVGGPPTSGGQPAGRGGVLGETKSGGDQPGDRSSGANSEQSAVLPIARPESGPGGGGSPMDLTIIIVPIALATFAFVLFRELRRQT